MRSWLEPLLPWSGSAPGIYGLRTHISLHKFSVVAATVRLEGQKTTVLAVANPLMVVVLRRMYSRGFG